MGIHIHKQFWQRVLRSPFSPIFQKNTNEHPKMSPLSLLVPVFSVFATFPLTHGSTECVWATGRVLCNSNQSKVLGAVVELWDLDSPQNSRLKNPVDPDDKAGFTLVDDKQGLWQLEGCASDQDWIPGVPNRPEFYLRVWHQCNTVVGEWRTILPVFRVFTPHTYDYHIAHPIVLDTPTWQGGPVANGTPVVSVPIVQGNGSASAVEAAEGGGGNGLWEERNNATVVTDGGDMQDEPVEQ